MKIITADKIKNTVSDLCVQANLILRSDTAKLLKAAFVKEKNKRAKKILQAIIKNARIAQKERLAICQDTGLPCVFVEIGQNIRIVGDLKQAITEGVESGYKKGSFRASIAGNPLLRGTSEYSPAVIHTEITKGSRLKLTVFPKGFGCENKAQLKMFNPTAEITEIKKFIIDAVRVAGPDACPPYIVGVGIGGTADYAMYLAKKALLQKITDYPRLPDGQGLPITDYVSKLEQELLTKINQLNIGPMGLGGKNTCLGVNIETYPTHIAGLPVAVNISCHALRSASTVL